MAKKIEIFCTLGPKTLNKSFLKNIKGKVNLVRLNLSHISLADLQIELLKLDMASTKRDSIEALFEGYEEDPIAERMREKAQKTLALRNYMDDRELIESAFDIKPRGRIDVETTAYS